MNGPVFLMLAIACGHLCLTIAVMNWSQGHGINLKWMDQVILAVLGVVGMTFVAGVWFVWGRPLGAWPLPMQMYGFLCLGIVGIALPATTLARHLRRHPQEARLTSNVTHDLAEHCGIDELIGPGRSGRLLSLPGNESLRVQVSEWDLTLDSLPRALSGLSLLHLTDLHFAHSYRRRYFEEVVGHAMDGGFQPDLVCVTGDFLDDDDAISWIQPVLGPLTAKYGKLAILGNHDYRHDFRAIRRELRAAGFTTLEGRWTTIDTEGGRLVIGGTSYPWGRDLDPSRMPAGDFRILMSHAPDQVFRAAQWGMDLMLCGHNHGGQIRLPVLGPILMPSRYGRRFDRGFYREGPTTMFVGQGIGGKHPLRFGCLPEVTRMRLTSSANVLTQESLSPASGRSPRGVFPHDVAREHHHGRA